MQLITKANVMNKPAAKAVAKTAPTREQLRAGLVGSTPKGKSKLIQLYGFEIELRQPSLKAILKTRDAKDDTERAVDMIIEYAYVPGSDEKIFEDTDRDHILRWPFGEDLAKLNEAIADLTGVDIKQAMEELENDPLEG